MSVHDRKERLQPRHGSEEILPQGVFNEFVKRCMINDEEVRGRTKAKIQKMAFDVWQFSMTAVHSGRAARKQQLINRGMWEIITTALGDYHRDILNPAMAQMHVEMKDGNRIKHAYLTGDGDELNPDSCIIPTYKDQGNDFVLMYKMNMRSIAKNSTNAEKNISGEMHEFHRCADNHDRFLTMINVSPTVSFRPLKNGLIEPEKVPSKDYEARIRLRPEDEPGSYEYRSRAQTAICDMKFDWHPDIIASMTSFKDMARAINKKGINSILLDTIDMSGLDRLIRQIINSYDPLNERTLMALKEAPVPEPSTKDEIPAEMEEVLAVHPDENPDEQENDEHFSPYPM